MVKQKMLVCGGTGFIGRNMAEYFAREYEVIGTFLKSGPYYNPDIKMVRADLRIKADVDRIMRGTDVVIQAAATTSGVKDILSKPYEHVTDTTIMNSLVFRAALEHNVKHMVFFSCSIMYQTKESPCLEKPVVETDFDANAEIYPGYFGGAWMKVYCEKMCEFYSRLGGTKYTVIRHSNVYGPHDKYDLEKSHVFGATMTKVMTAPEGGKITVWGRGCEERDFIYAGDLVKFVKLSLEKQESKYELFNAGCGRAYSVRELVEKMIKKSGKNVAIEYDESKPTIMTKLALDCSKAKRLLGWLPETSLDEGIGKTMKWYGERG